MSMVSLSSVSNKESEKYRSHVTLSIRECPTEYVGAGVLVFPCQFVCVLVSREN